MYMRIYLIPFCLLSFINPINSFSVSRYNFLRRSVGVIATNKLLNRANDSADNEASATDSTDSGYPLTITFYSPVTVESCVGLTTYLKAMDMKSKQLQLQYGETFPIKLHIQSGGGMLMPTFYVCDVIKSLDTPVHIYIDGFVASAASLIAICGTKRLMTKHSFMLIHQLQSQSSGRLNEMKDEISNLDFFNNNAKDIYFQNSNITETMLDRLLSDELWIDATQCLELGLVDEII